MPTPAKRLAILTLILILAACGAPTPINTDPPNDDDNGNGNGNGNQPPTAPTLTLTPTAIKTFQFTWNASDDTTEYTLLEDPTGTTDPQPIATIPGTDTSYTHEISLPARINARYQLNACNQHGCTPSDIVGVTGTLTNAIGYLKASNTDEGHEFGFSVALSADGTTLAVGAPFEDSAATSINGDQGNDAAPDAGAVYVFTRTGTGTWAQQAYVKASNTDPSDRFGNSVALSADGTTLAVGAPFEASNATGINGNEGNDDASAAGAVYVFTRDGGVWTQQAYVKASNARGASGFGWSVALSANGNTLAAGAIGENSNATGIDGDQTNTSAVFAGAVYVFARSEAGTWSQQAYVKASNTPAFFEACCLYFGLSVALSGDGDTLAVSSPGERSNATGIDGDQTNASAPGAGAVYVFGRARGTWAQQAYVKASNTGSGDGFGRSVALSADGTTLAVAAYQEDSNATGINGNQSNGDAENAGAVYVFTRARGVWTQQAYVKASNTGSDHRFGNGVALSADGATLAVSAPGEGSEATGIDGDQTNTGATNAGAVYVFTRNQGTWAQQAYVKASNTGPADAFGGSVFGNSVALSADGTTLAIGAPFEGSNATGVGGDQSDDTAPSAGAVYLY